jgi:hypothetical protein
MQECKIRREIKKLYQNHANCPGLELGANKVEVARGTNNESMQNVVFTQKIVLRIVVAKRK